MRKIDEELLIRIGKYIEQTQVKEGRSPTQREIMAEFRITAPRAHKYIHTLEERGLLELRQRGKKSLIEIPYHIDSSDVNHIALVSSIRCGEPTAATEDFEGVFKIPQAFTGTGDFFMLRAKGDSMTGAGIESGDYLIIREQQTANSGDIVAAIRHSEMSSDNGEATLKRFVREGGKYILRPENEAYEDIDASEYKILGKLVGFYRKLV